MRLIDTKTIIDSHQTCIEIMEGIASFQRQILTTSRNIDEWEKYNHFPGMIERYEDRIDTWERCIVRLLERYDLASEGAFIKRSGIPIVGKSDVNK